MSNPEAGYYAEAASRLVRTGEHVAPHVVLQRKGDDALVKTVTDFVIASGYDEASGTWGQGRYFGDDAVSAFSAFNAAELYEDHLPGITAQGVLDREPGLTLEEAETVAFCANDNLACSDHFADLVYDQVGAEIEHVVDDFSPERRRAFDLEKRLLAGETLYNPVTGTYVDSNLDTDEPNYFVGNVEITAAASFIGERMGTGACFYDISDASPRDLPGVSMEYVEASGPRRDVARQVAAALAEEPGKFVYPRLDGVGQDDPVKCVAGALGRCGNADVAEAFTALAKAQHDLSQARASLKSPAVLAALATAAAGKATAPIEGPSRRHLP